MVAAAMEGKRCRAPRGARRVKSCLFIEARVHIVHVFRIHTFFAKTQAFAKALEVYDFTFPQEADHIVHIRVVR